MDEKEKSFPHWSFTQNYKRAVRGMAPQHLIDTITRHKIYNSVYWQQYCFGVNLVTFVDRTQHLTCVGGLYGVMKQPCNFYCLFLKLLELEPSETVINCFLSTRTWQMKHLRLLAALYVRFTYPPESVYTILEPLLFHYNKISVLTSEGHVVRRFDEVIQDFLECKFWCGISLPPLTPRTGLPARISPLRHLEAQLREEIYGELGMTPEGELLPETPTKGLRLKNNLRLKTRKEKLAEKPVQAMTRDEKDEIAEENRIRALLGLPPLK